MDFERYKQAYAKDRIDFEEAIERMRTDAQSLNHVDEDFISCNIGKYARECVYPWMMGRANYLEQRFVKVYESRANWRLAAIVSTVALIVSIIVN